MGSATQFVSMQSRSALSSDNCGGKSFYPCASPMFCVIGSCRKPSLFNSIVFDIVLHIIVLAAVKVDIFFLKPCWGF